MSLSHHFLNCVWGPTPKRPRSRLATLAPRADCSLVARGAPPPLAARGSRRSPAQRRSYVAGFAEILLGVHASLVSLADVIVERLRAAGTRAMFGVPGGGGNLDLIEAGRRAGLPFVLTSTETGAAIAAMAHADVTGRPGACLTTLGPGAASAVNGVACAFLDRSRIIVFTDSNAEAGQGRFLHQQLDQGAMLAPITKWSGRLTAANAIATVDQAFEELGTLPPGPVHVDCPSDVWAGADGSVSSDSSVSLTAASSAPSDFLRVLRASAKPLLIVGLGARRPEDAIAIRQLCERRRIPAMVTYKAKGVVPDDHPSFAGVFTNSTIERPIVDESDLLIGMANCAAAVASVAGGRRHPLLRHDQERRDALRRDRACSTTRRRRRSATTCAAPARSGRRDASPRRSCSPTSRTGCG